MKPSKNTLDFTFLHAWALKFIFFLSQKAGTNVLQIK